MFRVVKYLLFVILMSANIWAVNIVQSVHITSVASADRRALCPKKINITGHIKTVLPGKIRYRFVYSDGVTSPVKSKNIHWAANLRVKTTRRFRSNFNGWVKLKVLGPNQKISRSFPLRVRCQNIRPPHPVPRQLVQSVKFKTTTPNAAGHCPKKILFKGSIKVSHRGKIRYRFERSDGSKSAIHTLRVARAGTYTVRSNWKLRNTARGWVRLRVIGPNRMLSEKAHFKLKCLPQMPVIPDNPMKISEFRLEADPELPATYRGDCPKTIDFHGQFFASHAGKIRYRFVHSDGRVSQTHTIRANRPGFYDARHSWRIGHSMRGWARMEIISPVRVRSERAPFRVRCMDRPMPEPVVSPANLKVYVDAPSRAHAGESLAGRIKLKVLNHGQTRALGTRDGNGYKVDLILSSDRASIPEFARYSDTYSDNVLLKGGRVSHTVTLTGGTSHVYMPDATLPSIIPAGKYFLCARVDPGNVVRESKERDNLSCTPLRILRHQRPQVEHTLSPDILSEGTAVSTLHEETPNQTQQQKNSDHDLLADDTEAELLERFRPYFKFSKDEEYLPSDAMYQLQNAKVLSGKIADNAPSFLLPNEISECSDTANDPKQLLACDNQSMNLIQQMHSSNKALDFNNSLRHDSGSGKLNDWDTVISSSPGLYGHAVEDEALIKLEYWQFFPYSRSSSSASGHEGSWETIQLWYHGAADKIVGVCHWSHGAGICFDMNKAVKTHTENGFTYYRGKDTNHTLETLTANGLEANRYPSSYQNQRISFYTKDESMHPVVFVEKNSHGFWPTSDGIFDTGDIHDGEGHSYLATFDAKEKNLGELSATLPSENHSNSVILRYNGLWGAEHQNLAKPPHGPTLRCQWRYNNKEFEMSKVLRKVCEWE